jgi:hypothetical protein
MDAVISRATGLLLPLLLVAGTAVGEPNPVVSPPEGWANVCTGETVDVKPAGPLRRYAGTGSCWINTAPNKSDGSQQNWVRAALTVDGSYDSKSSTFTEKLSFSVPRANGQTVIPVTTNGSCGDDPWATASPCTASPSSVNLQSTFGWQTQLAGAPVSRNLYGAALVAGLLNKQAPSPPLAPVDLDAVRWPAFDGSGTLGRVFWRAPDAAGNRWIFAYDIEYAINAPNGAFAVAGHVVGPGAKTRLSLIELSRFFYTTFKLQPGDSYFRVCAINDAGRQCSAPVKAREPSRTELTAIARTHANIGAGSGPPAPSH